MGQMLAAGFLAPKLSKPEQFKLCLWLAGFKTHQECIDLLKSEFDKVIRIEAVRHYTTNLRWRKVIKRLRTQIERNLSKIPIANKSHRLKLLAEIRESAMTPTCVGYTKAGQPIFGIKEAAANQSLALARQEIEGERHIKINIDNSKHQYNTFIKIDAPKEELARDIVARLSQRSPQPTNGS